MCKFLSYLFVLKKLGAKSQRTEDKYMTSLTWIKRITGIGLSLMKPDVQRERMNAIFSAADTINGPALAQLIDECRTAAGMFLGNHTGEQADMIRDLLAQTDGKQIVANMDTDEDIAWLLELRENVYDHTLNIETLKNL